MHSLLHSDQVHCASEVQHTMSTLVSHFTKDPGAIGSLVQSTTRLNDEVVHTGLQANACAYVLPSSLLLEPL